MNKAQLETLSHYKNPKNYGKIDNSMIGKSENLSCGDSITMYLEIEDGMIQNAAFEGEGCSVSIGAASKLTEKLKGIKVAELKSFTDDQWLPTLGLDLNEVRKKCALMGLEAARRAVGC